MADLQVTTMSEGMSKYKEKSHLYQGFLIKPHQPFSILSDRIEKNIEYIDKNTVVFVSGSNLVCYDLDKETSKFLIRKTSNFMISSMSVGYKTLNSDEKKNDPYICLGEYNPITKASQITTISVRNPNTQHVLNSGIEKEKNIILEWKVTLSRILNNSNYCVGVSVRQNHSNILTKVSFWKYTQEKFISDVVLNESINYISYNPQNPLEIVLCGKGYLRLWNVFINEGSLKEHPQRFLKGKTEKEHNFIKAQFFDKKSFMFLVGTTENIFYIIEGFQIIYDFNASYSVDNIHDMNIQKIFQKNTDSDDSDDDGTFTNSADNTHNESKLKDRKSLLQRENTMSSNISERQSKTKSFMNSTREDSKIMFDNNQLKNFYLINNSYILMGFQKSSITFLYKLEKDFKNKKEKEMLMDKDSDEKKNIMEDQKVIRLATNVKSIINMMANSDRSQVMFMMELMNDENSSSNYKSQKKNKKDDHNKSQQSGDTSVCVYLFNRVGSKLNFGGEVFKEYFCFNPIISCDFNEKKKMVYTLTSNNWLRCFDYNLGTFAIKHHFNFDSPKMIVVCPHNNLFGVCFSRKFVLYALFRDKIKIFCEFDVINPYAKFTQKGDYIAIAGESQVNKNYCIYFIDSLYFNTAYVLENLPKIKKIEFMENDTYLFALSENSVVLGWSIRLDLMTISLMNRLKEYDKSVESYYFKLMYKHVNKGMDYQDLDYDSKNELLVVTHSNFDRISVYNKNGKSLYCQLDLQKHPVMIRIVKELNCLLLGMEDGSLRIYKWPFDANDGSKDSHINESKQLLTEISLHSKPLSNILISGNMKNIITASMDGSLIYSNLLTIKDNRLQEVDSLLEQGLKLKPMIEDIMKLHDVFEFRISDIKKKDKKVSELDELIKALKSNMHEQKDSVLNDHRAEITNLDYQKDDAINEEDKKEQQLRQELKNLKFNIENELQNRQEEHEKEKDRLSIRYNEKLQLYRNEIERLQQELKELQRDIEDKFKNIIHSQSDYFKTMYDAYNRQFADMKNKIEQSLKKLIKESAEYDDAIYTIATHYKEMMKDLSKRIDETEQKNQVDMANLKKALEGERGRENDFKNNLDLKVQESDKIIHKNAEIKKNIIDTTQRTITFQEQLLETEKNLHKIAKKMKDLDIKNKHLEQIRFVLEHRMTSLDKEKAPLEGQCIFLEKQKNSLQDEFNKLILQINLKNQFLENKQSQLRASLIQNFEINDQVIYIKKKLKHLQSEIKAFILTYQDDRSENLSIQENKATFVALKLRQFYDKYFSNSIDHELQNYQYYLSKLQEETEKMNIANNFDLIMRDKGEEKLISEKEKLEQIKVQKERGFKRMQNENTVLIAECNRLRKNLHEVYMHVVDIESKFESLTKINPGLNKTEIVYQIKEFIIQTHNKIKSNFQDGSNQTEMDDNNYDEERTHTNHQINYNQMNIDDLRNEMGEELLKHVNEGGDTIMYQNMNLDDLKVRQQKMIILKLKKNYSFNFLG
jgi:hypothetical protein